MNAAMRLPFDDPPAAAEGSPRRRLQLVETSGRLDVWGRPLTRGDCQDSPRPCPWVTCRYHLAVDVTATGARVIRPELAVEDMADTCALDVAEKHGGIRQEDVAAILDLSIESIRQTEIAARAGMRLAGGPALRRLFEEGAAEERDDGQELIGEQAAPMFWAPERDMSAEEQAAADAWAARVVALASVGVRLTDACRAATVVESDVDEEDEGARVAPEEVATMTRTEPELRKALLDVLEKGPRMAADLASELGEELERVKLVLGVLRGRSEAHCVMRGPKTSWHAGPTPEGEKPAKAPASKAKKASAPEPVKSDPPRAPSPEGKDAASRSASFVMAHGAPADLVYLLLTASSERLEAIERVLSRLNP